MREIRKFLLRASVLILPFLVLLGAPFFVLFANHELLSFKQITAIHNGDSLAVIGPAYSNPDKYMKLNTVLNRKPGILALGTSRVMQIRSFFFKQPASFYNAGGGIDKVKQFDFFLKQIPLRSQPTVVFVGLDQYFFNEKFDNLSTSDFDAEYNDNFSLLAYTFDNCFLIWHQLLSGKINFSSQHAGNFIGLNAGVNHNGFLFDGSYYYGERMQHPEIAKDYHFKDTFERIEKGIKRFEYSAAVNQKAIVSLDSFLSHCAARGIKVYGFLPPYANSVISKMRAMSDNYRYIENLYNAVRPSFDKYAFKVFDFTDMSQAGIMDKNFIDGFHGSDKVYLKMMMNMCGQDTSLNAYFDKEHLQTLYNKSKNDLEVL